MKTFEAESDVSETTADPVEATILLVEDDQSVRFVLHKSLAGHGYRVLEADNGAMALDLVESGESIDLVVTDVVMPVMGGFELAARLATENEEIKVLLISGYTQADGGLGGNRILAEGTDFLRKPFSMQLLADKVAEMLRT